MTIEIPIEIPAPSRLFKEAWKYAFAAGAIAAVLSVARPELTQVILITSFSIASLAGVVFGALCCFSKPSGAGAESPLADFRSNLWLHLKEYKSSTEQLDLFEKLVEDPKKRRRVFMMRSGTQEWVVVNADRYHELLVSRIGDTVDKVTDHALAVAWKQVKRKPGLLGLEDKVFREIVKADFRGNLYTLLSRKGAELEDELRRLAEPKPEGEAEPFKLEPAVGRRKRR